jgi:hypothetical protein
MTFSPYPGFDPCDGAEPRVELSHDNPCRASDPRAACATPARVSRRGPEASQASPALSRSFHEGTNG